MAQQLILCQKPLMSLCAALQDEEESESRKTSGIKSPAWSLAWSRRGTKKCPGKRMSRKKLYTAHAGDNYVKYKPKMEYLTKKIPKKLT